MNVLVVKIRWSFTIPSFLSSLTAGLESSNVVEAVTIPKNKILVLGDNRRYSYDSRRYGLVDESDVYGEVILRFFPFGSFKFF